MFPFRKKVLLGSAAAVALVGAAAGGAAWASSPAPTVSACVGKSSGAPRVLGTSVKCRSTERKVTWNQTGPRGAQGVPGVSKMSTVSATAPVAASADSPVVYLTAKCPAGTQVLGGGHSVTPGTRGEAILDQPTPDGTGWYVAYTFDRVARNGVLTVYARCAVFAG